MATEQMSAEITRLQEVVATHAKENNDLKVEVKTLKESLALFANDYHEGGRSTGRVLSIIQSGNLPQRPPAKKRAECTTVTQWTRKEYRRALVLRTNTQRGDMDGSSISTWEKGKRGRPRKDAKDDETLEGVPVADKVITEMSRKARMLWRTLHEDGMAPQTFGQISMKAWEYYSAMMLADKAFEFLLLCDNGEWKLREWSTRSYPSWHRNRFNKDADDVPQTDSTPEPTPADNGTGAENRPANDDEEEDDIDATGNNSSPDNGANELDQGSANDNDDNEPEPEVSGSQGTPPSAGTTGTDISASPTRTPLLNDPL
ncbi:hypothetical protein EI94DRAFT_1700465 [Lactarius quietus]|nr:hypothetical protein EI94DRAFT_1700465 [Lactarius quietus]